MKSTEKLIIFENVLARVGMNENTLREYNKAISGLMGFKSQLETMPPPMPTEAMPPPTGQMQPPDAGIQPMPAQNAPMV